MQQGGMTVLGARAVNQEKQVEEIYGDDGQAKVNALLQQYSDAYQQQFMQLMHLNPDSFSVPELFIFQRVRGTTSQLRGNSLKSILNSMRMLSNSY